nr:MAG TPA: hypothetical protein [Caudoviricetes sp.]
MTQYKNKLYLHYKFITWCKYNESKVYADD